MKKQLENLDLNLLLALHWLLTERNVTVAADRIGLSQPAASRALSRLREIFEDPLLVRTGGEMTPTPVAEKLQPALAHAIERCRDVLRLTTVMDPAELDGGYRVACADYAGAMVVAAWSKAVAPYAPKLELDIVNPEFETAQELISGKVDLVFLPDIDKLDLAPRIDVDQFVHKRIRGQRYLCAMRGDHPAAEENVTLKRYAAFDHILVAPDGSKTGIVDRMLAEQGLERRIAFRTQTFMLALAILVKTDAIITAPEGLLALYKENLRIFPPPLKVPSYSMNAGWHPNWTHDERHKWVRTRLFEAMADDTAARSKTAA